VLVNPNADASTSTKMSPSGPLTILPGLQSVLPDVVLPVTKKQTS
jgi:hypothetical protein